MSVSTMKKLIVISPSGEEDAVIKRLIKLKCVEVKTTQGDEFGYLLENLNCDSSRLEIEKKINVLERVIPELLKRTTRKGGLGDRRVKVNRDEFISDGSYDDAFAAAVRADSAMSRIAECRSEILSADSEISALTPWMNYGVSVDYMSSQHVDFTIGSFPSGTKISDVEQAVSELMCGIELVSEESGVLYVSVATHKDHAEAALRELTAIGFLKTHFKGIDTTPKKAIKALIEKKEELTEEITELDRELNRCAESLSDIEVIWDIERTNLVAVQSKQKMARTQNCVVLSAWVPEQNCQKVSDALEKLCCAYGTYDALDGEEPPVHLENNGFASTFEWVVGMYSYPKYGSFDPTFIMSIFYFFIFGLMFADVGYGLLLTLGGFLLPKVMGLKPGMKRSFYMFGYCGISSMVMGVLFGGWFGDMPYAIMQNFMGMENAKEAVPFFNGIWFNPIDDPMMFLIVGLAVGGVHLITGMAIQFVLLCKEGKVFDAIFDIGAWWIIFAGIGVLVLVGALPGAIICGVGVLMIVLTHGRNEKNIVLKIGKGLLGLYDITSYASDLLSYSRILALGLAAAVIAQVINLIGTMGGPTVIGFVGLIAASLLGHGLNLAINILGSFVHTSRLQYLEFFNKFYEDGGTEFKAIEPSEKYTID